MIELLRLIVICAGQLLEPGHIIVAIHGSTQTQ